VVKEKTHSFLLLSLGGNIHFHLDSNEVVLTPFKLAIAKCPSRFLDNV